MLIKTSKKEKTQKRHQRIRNKIFGIETRPRLAIYKSNKHIYAQIIDDRKSHTLVFCSTLSPEVKKELKATWSIEAAKKVGEFIAKTSIKKGVKKVIFDRGGQRYHGKVLAFANAAREAGLEF